MENILKQHNLPFLLLIGILIKSVVVSSPIFDGVAILALSSLFGFKLWLDHVKKPDHNEILNSKVDKNNEETQKQLNDLSNKISAISSNIALEQKTQNKTKYGW